MALRSLSWIVTLPLTLLAIDFAVSNRGPVTLALWPFPDRIDVPVFLAVLGPLGLGIVAGALAASVGALRARWLARRRGHRIAALTAELTALQRKETAPAGAAGAPGHAPP